MLILFNADLLKLFFVFSICTGAHAVAFCCYLYFYSSGKAIGATKSEGKVLNDNNA